MAAWKAAVEVGEALPMGDSYRLPREETMAKYLLLSLSFGILNPARFQRRFGEPLDGRFGETLALARSEGLLEPGADGSWGIPEGRFTSMPKLRALFYPAAALDWLERLRA